MDLAKLKAESEETMTQKIIPLEKSLSTTRDDLGATESRMSKAIQSVCADLDAQIAQHTMMSCS